jgi:FkbM family methyltransferase
MIERNGFTVHLDSPRERTADSHFAINGWVTGDEIVQAIWAAGQRSEPLSFYERPDVVRVFPARRFVRGFSGKGKRRDLGKNGLQLTLEIAGETIELVHPLPDSPPPLPLGRRLSGAAKLASLSLGARFRRVPSQRWDLVLQRHLLKRELRSKIFRREHTDALLADFAAVFPEAVFLQIGANDGMTGDPLCGLLTGAGSNWRGVMVEPVAHLFEQLRSRYRSRPRLQFERAAIGEEDGTTPIYRIRMEQNDPLWLEQLASLDREVLRRTAEGLGGASDRIISEQVACLSVRTLLQRHDIQSLDLLVIDTEGWDWRVLRQFNFPRIHPRLILYEHQHLAPLESKEAHAFLARFGYDWAETPEGDTIAWR